MKKFLTLIKKIKTEILISLLVLFGGVVSIFWISSRADAQPAIYAGQGVDKTKAIAGDALTYTLNLENTGGVDLHNTLISENLSSYVTYQAGSTKLQKNDKTINIDDNWLNTGTNIGTLIPSQKAQLTFKVTIKSDAPIGSTVETTSQVKTDELPDWIQRAAQTQVVSVNDKAVFTGGDVFQGVNNTKAEVDWHDPVSAVVGNVIQFKFRIVNSGGFESRNTKVRIQIPWDPKVLSNTLMSTATVTADNADSMSDKLAVYLAGDPGYMWPKDGHYFIVGTTDLYKCPTGCPVPNQFLWEPMSIGSIVPGASVEILFKADIPLIATPTPTVTPTPTITPTPTPTQTPTPSGTPNSCGGTCGSNYNCQGGLMCYNGYCRNPQCVTNSDCSCASSTPPVLSASTPPNLPKTGSDGISVVLGLFGVTATGIYIFRKFRLI